MLTDGCTFAVPPVVGKISRHIWPFVVAMYALLLVCMFFPALVLTLPRALGY